MSSSQETLVLHAGGDELRLVRGRMVRGKVELSNAWSCPSASEGRNVSALQDENALDALADYVEKQDWVGQDLVCLISGSPVACHYYDLPPLKGDKLRQAVLLKLGQQLHFNVDEATVVVETLATAMAEKADQVRVGAAALRLEVAEAATSIAERTGLRLKSISAAPAALTALAGEALGSDTGLQALLYVDQRASTLVVLNDALPWVTSELPIGTGDLVKALMRPIVSGDDLVHLEEEQAEALWREVGVPEADQDIESLGITGDKLIPLLEPILQQFTKELTQWLTFASTMAGGGGIPVLAMVGPGAVASGFAETIAERLTIDSRTVPWIESFASMAGPSEGHPLESHAAAVSAVRNHRTLPDLTPLGFRRKQKLKEVRRSVILSATIATVAIVGFAVLFDRLGGALVPVATVHREQLAGVQEIVGANDKWLTQQKAAERLQQELEDFSRATPSWIGIFKELAVLLPRDVQASEFIALSRVAGIRLTVNGAVYSGQSGRGFDAAVEQALLLLQRSAFFQRVQLLTATRKPPPDAPGASGALAIELELIYPRLRT